MLYLCTYELGPKHLMHFTIVNRARPARASVEAVIIAVKWRYICSRRHMPPPIPISTPTLQ